MEDQNVKDTHPLHPFIAFAMLGFVPLSLLFSRPPSPVEQMLSTLVLEENFMLYGNSPNIKFRWKVFTLL